MIPEVANPYLARVLEISEEIVRFSKAGGRSHFYFNTERNFAGVVCCHIEEYTALLSPKPIFEKKKKVRVLLYTCAKRPAQCNYQK